MREGMAGKVGIGKLALYGREYLVAVQPRENGLVMYTLRQAAEIRAMTQIDELGRLPEKTKPQEAKLARQVIETFERPLDLNVYRDDYQAELRRIIDAKVAGQDVVATPEETPSNVVDLMEALRRSLDTVSANRKTPAKASLPRTKAGGKRTEREDASTSARATPARRRKAS